MIDDYNLLILYLSVFFAVGYFVVRHLVGIIK